jgi:chaperonin cofactor prefoldin
MEEKEKKTVLPIAFVILLVIVLLYLLTLGKANFLGVDLADRRKNLEERKKIVDQQHNRVAAILDSKKQLKQKLDKINLRALLITRIAVVLLLFLLCMWAKFYFLLSVLDITGYVGLCLLAVTFLAFIVFGNPSKAIDFLSYIENKLTLMIYRKYINLERHFEKHEAQISNLTNEKTKLDDMLNEIRKSENELLSILNEKN